jgi:hypothetical protein
MSLSLGAQGIEYLNAGQWEADVGYRYLHSDQVFMGKQEQPQLYNVGGRNTINSFDLTANYGVISRLSLGLTVPFLIDNYSLVQGDFQRHGGTTGGLGDMRLVANGWLLDPATHLHGNVLLGLGVKFPTGDYHATGDWHQLDGSVIIRPVDIAAQLGDGGFGIVFQLQAFQELVHNLYGYAQGFYLSNPRDINGVSPMNPNLTYVNSVPDSYFARMGLSYVIWPQIGLSLSFGGRVDGVPVQDLIGDNDGFRRAGYTIYVDPGLNWSYGKNSLSVNVPVAVLRNLQATTYSTRGGLASFLVVAGYSRRF